MDLDDRGEHQVASVRWRTLLAQVDLRRRINNGTHRPEPQGKNADEIPAIIDPDAPNELLVSVFDSGALLIYLAEKTGVFLPRILRRAFRYWNG